MESAIIGVLILAVLLIAITWFIVKLIRGILRGLFGSPRPASSERIRFPPPAHALAESSPSTALVQMPDATTRLFTYEDECRAAQARQRLWMRYEDRQGHVTERTVEIYQPEDDEVIFAWCSLARAPRTFARQSIQSWRLMPDRFVFDPIIAQYWEEEGTRDMSEKLPWRRWLDDQPDHIADRYP
jgi:hypothetical protein